MLTADTAADAGPAAGAGRVGGERPSGTGMLMGFLAKGVWCGRRAAALPDAPAMGAISVFGPQARTTETAIETIVAGLQRVAVELSRDFNPEA
ncbi:hypothetical protein EAS64_20845 [Trebonia kvetii]|uniref:IclR-ED domain-containing protein n=1 Tax=Trebonia kvetii TaxID=2480626 RepID=A0A6P2BV37_9ACTN|nr:hypothetical protein [Trebonia kvetii]TVZ02924.1 hypothetical protein EAS64_20845 [Trebonia kvetii]